NRAEDGEVALPPGAALGHPPAKDGRQREPRQSRLLRPATSQVHPLRSNQGRRAAVAPRGQEAEGSTWGKARGLREMPPVRLYFRLLAIPSLHANKELLPRRRIHGGSRTFSTHRALCHWPPARERPARALLGRVGKARRQAHPLSPWRSRRRGFTRSSALLRSCDLSHRYLRSKGGRSLHALGGTAGKHDSRSDC